MTWLTEKEVVVVLVKVQGEVCKNLIDNKMKTTHYFYYYNLLPASSCKNNSLSQM